jgi:ketosteroid isomerase-like protein
MSQENVDFVRRVFAEFGGGPPQENVEEAARAGLIAPDIEIDFSAVYPDGPIVHGLEGWGRYVDALPWGRSLKLEPERFFDVDDERVLVLVRVTAEGEESGVPVEMHDAHEFTIRNGVFVRWMVYADQEKALEAAGLEE